MPAYDYQCNKCGRIFTVTRAMSDKGAPLCPHCRSKDTHQLTSAFYAKTIKKS